MPLAPGVRLGHYEVLGSLGAGGMGEVYRASDTKLGREVAIKVLPAEFAHDPDRLARFEREAKLLASLNHPNIAHVYGFETATLADGVDRALPRDGAGRGRGPRRAPEARPDPARRGAGHRAADRGGARGGARARASSTAT